MQRPPFHTLFKEKTLWLLIGIGVLYFHRSLFLGETFFFRELLTYLLPEKYLFADSINHGIFPLWDPYIHGGLPYIGNISHSPLYPSNLLYFILPFFYAFNLNIVFHLILSCVAAYLFARILGFQPLSSAIVGIIYGFCGYTLAFTNLVAAFMAVPLLPLLLMFWHLYLLEHKSRWFGLTVLAGVIRVFAGAPEANIIGMLFLLGWALLYPYPNRSVVRDVLAWSIVGILTIGIASVQILPTLEALLQSSRGQPLTYEEFSYWSLYPKRLPELIFPNFLGYLDTLEPQRHYWGGNIVPVKQAPYIISIYFGLITLTLAVIGGFHAQRSPILSLKIRKTLLLVAGGTALLALGQSLPFFELVYRYMPFIGFFRYPIKFLSISILPIALLAGYAVEIYFIEGQTGSTIRYSRRLLGVFLGIAAILMLFTGIFRLSDTFAFHFQETYFHESSDIIRQGLTRSFSHASLIWLLFTLLYFYRGLTRRQWQQWLLACIVFADLLIAGQRLNPTAPRELFADIPPIVPLVREEIGNGRLFRTPDPLIVNVLAPSNDMVWKYRWGLEVLEDFRATFYQLPIIFHKGLGLAPERLQRMRETLAPLSWEQRLPLLSAGAVTLIITSEDLQVPGIRRIAEIPNRSDLPMYLYRHTETAERLEFVTSWEWADTGEATLQAMLQSTFDPRRHVILEVPPSPLFETDFTVFRELEESSSFSEGCVAAPIETIRATPHTAEYSVSTPCDGYLVFSETLYPGWKITVDGIPAPILRANYAFSAVFLSAGDHEVIRYYRPNSLIYGIIVSLVFCGILGILSWKGWGIT